MVLATGMDVNHTNLTPWRAFATALLLVIHVVFGAGLLPEAVALLAWMDGQHRVLVLGRPGLAWVVLAHDARPGADPERAVGHRHHELAKIFTRFAGDAKSPSDHVLRFESAAQLMAPRDPSLRPPAKAGVADAAAAFTPSSPFPAPRYFVAAPPPPSLDPCRFLKSVRLLI